MASYYCLLINVLIILNLSIICSGDEFKKLKSIEYETSQIDLSLLVNSSLQNVGKIKYKLSSSFVEYDPVILNCLN